MKNIAIKLSSFNSVTYLWSELIEKIGFDNAKKVISQASDLQKMHGKKNITMPIVFTGTAGLALISIELVRKNTSINDFKGNQVLIFNPKKKLFQVLLETTI